MSRRRQELHRRGVRLSTGGTNSGSLEVLDKIHQDQQLNGRTIDTNASRATNKLISTSGPNTVQNAYSHCSTHPDRRHAAGHLKSCYIPSASHNPTPTLRHRSYRLYPGSHHMTRYWFRTSGRASPQLGLSMLNLGRAERSPCPQCDSDSSQRHLEG